jgi:hypothetical protein
MNEPIDHVEAKVMNDAAEEKLGEKVDRWFPGPETKPEPEHRSKSQSESPIADESYGDSPEEKSLDQKLDEMVERWVPSDPKPAKEKAASEQDVQAEAPEPAERSQEMADEDFVGGVFTAAEAQAFAQHEIVRRQLDSEIAEYQHYLALAQQEPNPDRRMQSLAALSQIEQSLRERVGSLDRVREQLDGAARGRESARLERLKKREIAKIQKAHPRGVDAEKLRGYLKKEGFNDQRIDYADAAAVILFEKARLWDEHTSQEKAKPRVIRKVNKAPKKATLDDKLTRIFG